MAYLGIRLSVEIDAKLRRGDNMEGAVALSGIWMLFLLIVGILALLMPFFVLRIRNEVISMNQKMSILVKSLGASDESLVETNSTKGVKRCRSCGAKNRLDDHACINCGRPF